MRLKLEAKFGDDLILNPFPEYWLAPKGFFWSISDFLVKSRIDKIKPSKSTKFVMNPEANIKLT